MQKKNWKVLFFKSAFLTCLIVVSFVVIRYVYIQRMKNDNFMGCLNDKHTNLNKMPAPRLILVGGSNVLYGFNTDTLQRHFKIPVMNMAMMAPLGLNFILGDIERDLKNGDTVVLSPEYDIEVKGDTEYLLWASDFYHPANDYVVYKDSWQDRIRAFFVHQIRMFQEIVSFKSANLLHDNLIYYRGAISPKGDIKSHENKPRRKVSLSFNYRDSLNYSEQISVINKFAQRYREKGVNLYVIYPSVPKTTYEIGKNAILDVESQINKNLQCKVLGKPTDFVYADTLFFDTYYHLMPQGRENRTQKLLAFLKSESLVNKNIVNSKSN